MIFADPPYFLSNGGISYNNGQVVCVDKGDWDKGGTTEYIDNFNRTWLTACKNKLKDDGTIWVSGTYHNIFSVGHLLSELGFKIINVITWVKPQPAPSIKERNFTFASEYIIWAKKTKRSYQTYNKEIMRKINNGAQMTDVWIMPTVEKWEKSCGRHPTQKPLSLLARIILASTKPGDWILDPFAGSGTTGIASSLLGRRSLGIEQNIGFIEIAENRREEIERPEIFEAYNHKIIEAQGQIHLTPFEEHLKNNVLVARVGSPTQWNWINGSMLYNLPLSKIGSLTGIMDADYVLLYGYRHPEQFKIYRLSAQAQKQMTKEEIAIAAKSFPDKTGNCYKPSRDNLYLMLKLLPCDSNKLIGKRRFHQAMLVKSSEQNCTYWLKPLEAVLESFE